MGSRTSVKSSTKRLLLEEEELARLVERHLAKPKRAPDGDETRGSEIDPSPFSTALGEAVVARFTATSERAQAWQRSVPIALGSWARGELCPKSDLDILFAGDESAAGEVTAWAQEMGLKIRGRVPKKTDDWMVGVETFDVLSLMAARPLTGDGEGALAAQHALFEKRRRNLRRTFLTVCRKERADRAARYDSIANFLEPNLKYGTGGLRDLEQALSLRRLFGEKFGGKDGTADHAVDVYDYYRRFFLMARIRTHLAEGGGDLLSAYEQQQVASWFGYGAQEKNQKIDGREASREFMRQIQRGLSRVSFYTDVDFERARVSERWLRRFDSVEPKDFSTIARDLEKDPDLWTQSKARQFGSRLFQAATGRKKRMNEKALARLMVKSIDPMQDEATANAFFRSRLIDLAVTDFTHLVGYVQHDQYHRYTVDAHLLQAVRETKRVAARPTSVGRLARIAKGFSREDWRILGWTALYHDVGKGHGGDHSDRSTQIAKRDLPNFGVSGPMLEEILWLIENHLELSVAAFRGNPASVKTWRALQEKGVEGKRLLRLAIFTAIDIRATNREAYTPWKERLLAELVQNLEKPEAKNLAQIRSSLKNQNLWDVAERLDPFLVAALPPAIVCEDILTSARRKAGAHVRLVRLARSNRFWIRFHIVQDARGLFACMTRVLQKAGLSVRHASILSDPTLGIYDWFEVKPPKGTKGLEERLTRLLATETSSLGAGEYDPRAHGSVEFDSVDALSDNDGEWVISFRGKDQAGALRSAADALLSEGSEITWAKVHTWGRQLDDVFGVKAQPGGIQDLVDRLRQRVLAGGRGSES